MDVPDYYLHVQIFPYNDNNNNKKFQVFQPIPLPYMYSTFVSLRMINVACAAVADSLKCTPLLCSC